MEDDDIGDIIDDIKLEQSTPEELEQVICEAISCNENALNLLIAHPWTVKILDEVSKWAEWKFEQDRSDVRQIVFIALYFDIHKIKNPNGKSWGSCLKSWLYTIARNHCLNKCNHEKVVRKDCEKQVSESVRSKQGKGAIVIYHSTVLTPEEQLLKKEQNSLWRVKEQQLKDSIRSLVNSLPQHTVGIVRLWAEGMSPENIAQKTGKSRATIYRALKTFQKEIIKGIGIEQVVLTDPSLAAGLRPLIASSLH